MKQFLFISAVFIATLQSCSGSSVDSADRADTLKNNKLDSELIQCPYGHTDSIVPVIYGYPNEEDFQKADSGKVALGGCSLPDNPAPWFCKVHQVYF
jgi:hypothetical protein